MLKLDMVLQLKGCVYGGCRVDFNTQAGSEALSSQQQEELSQLRSAVRTLFASSMGPASSMWSLLLILLPARCMPFVQVCCTYWTCVG